jgi:hypothetical protein
MSTAISATEESWLSKISAATEEALFGVIYNLQKTRKEDLVRINYLTGLSSILLDFIQLVPFFVHCKFFLIF